MGNQTQRTMPSHKYKTLDIAGKSRKEVGDVGERFVCDTIPCQTTISVA